MNKSEKKMSNLIRSRCRWRGDIVGHNEKKAPMYECRICKDQKNVPVFVGSLKSVYRHNIKEHGLLVRSRQELSVAKKRSLEQDEKKKRRAANAVKAQKRSEKERMAIQEQDLAVRYQQMFLAIGLSELEVYEGCSSDELMGEYLGDLLEIWENWGGPVTRLFVDVALKRAARKKDDDVLEE